MPVELVIGALSVADLCLKYGKKLLQLYRDVKGAHKDLEDKILQVESIWRKTSVQIGVMKKVNRKIDDEQRRIQEDLMERLWESLASIVRKLESHCDSQSDRLQQIRFAVAKDSIERALHELEKWHKLYDPTWFLITLMSDTLLDTELQTIRNDTDTKSVSALAQLRSILHGQKPAQDLHVTLNSAQFDLAKAVPIKYNDIKIYSRTSISSGTTQTCIIDSIPCKEHTNVPSVRADAENLARTLKTVDPETFGLLRCQGLVKTKSEKTQKLEAMHLVFLVQASLCTSLHEQLLTRPATTISLTRRLEIAKSLANSVAFVHVCNLVHKNIRPESIICFSDQSVFLLGFDGFRTVHYQTLRMGDNSLERNLYQHPTRQGMRAQENYVMQHDIYSLGVCMVEVGLWASLLGYEDEDDGGDIAAPHKVTPAEILGDFADYDLGNWPENTRFGIKNRLLELARSRLPCCMGERYAAATVACLTCLDDDTNEFEGLAEGTGVKDENGVVVGVRFIEKILLGLNQIAV
ncbi:hypothetical protein QBC35DRAFT_393875 [Podospora australis]|uniref:Protein kinase domain-containing protein n=1 Tax=Podospora australis TaxID=1536484 RepID=A0AAN6WKE0_9PEZI|nr:hypothetical protein QBC35DRAFT_393875 [Podospora australis]